MEKKRLPIKYLEYAVQWWSSLRDYRRLSPYEMNSRNAVTIAFTGSLLAFILAGLSIKATTVNDWVTLFDGHEGLKALQTDQYRLAAIFPQSVNCSKDCDRFGLPKLAGGASSIATPEALNDKSISQATAPGPADGRYWARLDYIIDPKVLLSVINGHESVVVGIHQIKYRIAVVRANGIPWGTYTGSKPIRISLPVKGVKDQPLSIQVSYLISDDGITFLDRRDQVPPFVARPSELRRVEVFEANSRDNSGSVVGLMSRILIAVFALMLFLFIDSAPESLGLALLLGFEALAIALGQDWIHTKWNNFIIHYSFQMGDIFRLYFFLQLSRVTKPNPVKWLVVATALSIPYGIARQFEVQWNLPGLTYIPLFRDSFAGSVGALACLWTLWTIRKMKLPWRRVALILGALGSIQQVIGPMTYFFPEMNQSDFFRGFYVVAEALSVYVLALSAFTNISTLENRVKNLSEAKARSDLIEQELELGRTVQRAFLTIPQMHQDFEVAANHEAAVYVSGDIYFVNWDPQAKRLVVLLADVTGHGVQASLKATALYMVARNLWKSIVLPPGTNDRRSRSIESKFPNYHVQTAELLHLFSSTPDITAFAGVEIFPDVQKAFFYRNNFHTPMILQRNESSQWTIFVPPVNVGVVWEFDIRPGTVIALFSDGFVDGSRQFSSLRRYFSERLQNYDGSANELKNLFLEFNDQNTHRPADDRTVITISWQRDSQKLKKDVA